MEEIEYYDLFSGYGGIHEALLQSGFKFSKCYFSEIDKYAIANYKYNFNESEYLGPVEHVRPNPSKNRKILSFGWPCQDNSIAGKRKGQSGRYFWTARDGKDMSYERYQQLRSKYAFYLGERESKTRSGLLHEATRITRELLPDHFIAENVKGLLSVNAGVDIVETFRILSNFNDSGPQYDVEMQLLNTRWFLPQNRERVFFVGHLRAGRSGKVFPIGENEKRDGKEGNKPWSRLEGVALCLSGHATRYDYESETFIVHNMLPRNIKSGKGGTGHLTRSDGVVYSITTWQNQNAIEEGERIRRLTPIECERLQGLKDNHTKFGIFQKQVWINKKEKTFKIVEGVEEISDTQRYKLAGNGVSIPVVKAIGSKLIKNYSIRPK
jgi:DNA (cytosine-5)-methyltransferase 1